MPPIRGTIQLSTTVRSVSSVLGEMSAFWRDSSHSPSSHSPTVSLPGAT
jgi:hypothetical protein